MVFGRREIQVLRELHSRACDKEIADRMEIAPGSIKIYLNRIRGKMQRAGFPPMSRVDLALWIERGGLTFYLVR